MRPTRLLFLPVLALCLLTAGCAARVATEPGAKVFAGAEAGGDRYGPAVDVDLGKHELEISADPLSGLLGLFGIGTEESSEATVTATPEPDPVLVAIAKQLEEQRAALAAQREANEKALIDLKAEHTQQLQDLAAAVERGEKTPEEATSLKEILQTQHEQRLKENAGLATAIVEQLGKTDTAAAKTDEALESDRQADDQEADGDIWGVIVWPKELTLPAILLALFMTAKRLVPWFMRRRAAKAARKLAEAMKAEAQKAAAAAGVPATP